MSLIDTQHLHKLVKMVSKNWNPINPRCAALVVSRVVDFGLARMYEMHMQYKSKNKIGVFNDIQKALDWLSSQN